MGKKSPRVDAYITKSRPFAQPILRLIRESVHTGCPDVEETIKWSVPHFDYKGPLCGMAAFQEHVRFGFWKAALLGGKSSGDGMAQFGTVKSTGDLPSRKELIALVREAAALNDRGVKAPRPNTAPKPPLKMPSDFAAALKNNRTALALFEKFSPSHKREYIEWITDAKQDATRARRIATAVDWVAQGKSRNWKYER